MNVCNENTLQSEKISRLEWDPRLSKYTLYYKPTCHIF
jgi:hypothetical protein